MNENLTKKEVYEKPEVEIIHFSTEDIITASGDNGEGDFDFS